MPVRETDENYEMCICPQCPTYPGDDPPLYCGRGASDKPISRFGCMCPQCPVFARYQLKDIYFCAEGAAP